MRAAELHSSSESGKFNSFLSPVKACWIFSWSIATCLYSDSPAADHCHQACPPAKSWKWTNNKDISSIYQVYGIFEELLVRYKHKYTIYLSYTRYIPDIWQRDFIERVYTRYILYLKSIYLVYTCYNCGIYLTYDEVIHIPGIYLSNISREFRYPSRTRLDMEYTR